MADLRDPALAPPAADRRATPMRIVLMYENPARAGAGRAGVRLDRGRAGAPGRAAGGRDGGGAGELPASAGVRRQGAHRVGLGRGSGPARRGGGGGDGRGRRAARIPTSARGSGWRRSRRRFAMARDRPLAQAQPQRRSGSALAAGARHGEVGGQRGALSPSGGFVDGRASRSRRCKRVDDAHDLYRRAARAAGAQARRHVRARAVRRHGQDAAGQAQGRALRAQGRHRRSAQRRALGAFVLLQDGQAAAEASALEPRSGTPIWSRPTSYFLGVDAVGISRCPDWAWYTHDATRRGASTRRHDQAISHDRRSGATRRWRAHRATTGSAWRSRCAPTCGSRCWAA